MADSGVFSGRLTDGRSASSRMVTVRLARALELDPGGAVPETWAFHRLRPAVPLGKRSADVLLSSQDHPGATLFVAEPAFVKAILAVAPQLSQTAERWRYAKPALLATAVVGLIAAAVYAFDLSPAAGIARMLPHDVRVLIGEQSVKSFTSGHKFCNAPAGTQALDAMAKKLSDAAGPGARFSVKVVDWDMVNAFAMPGEQVVLMRGLIEKAENPDEVAGVLAHEMGHGLALHPEAGIIRSVGIAAGMEMVLTGSSGTLGNIGGMLLQMQFTRQAETDADTHALELLRGARISSKPLAAFFDRLAKEEGVDTSADAKAPTGGTNIFSTHPPSPERAKRAAEAATYAFEPALDAASWQALKGICSSTDG